MNKNQHNSRSCGHAKQYQMNLALLFSILLAANICYSQSKNSDDYEIANIKNVITLFKQKNIDKISNIINYPLRREYPIPGIKNKTEFKRRFSEVFDKSLVDMIANSKATQWSEVGWRGIMLDNGVVWIDSDEGKIIAVNYQSNFEKNLEKI